MAERMFVEGNEAVGWGALAAGCEGFFGYPITPQNETTNWFAHEFPKRGRVFVQTESETGSINMLMGGAIAGARVMTSTSSPGWSLMQEGMSHIAAAELPCVVVLVSRGGPGGGTTRHSQMDYMSTTKGGGHGGYKTIVLAPASVQETHDLVQLAFYLADIHRTPVVLLSDGIVGQAEESLDVETIDFGPVPDKEWAFIGREKHMNKTGSLVISTGGIPIITPYPTYVSYIEHLKEKYQHITDTEVRYEMYQAEDAQLLTIAFGYCARSCKEAVNTARDKGLKVGLLRPITLWPFPSQIIKEKASQGCKILVVEDNQGLMVEDVKIAVEGRAEVNLLDISGRHLPTDGGMIMPGRVFEEVNKLL